MSAMERRGTRGCDAPLRSVVPSGARVFPAGSWNTPSDVRAKCAPFCKFSGVVGTGLQEMTFTSPGAANCIRRRGSIRKNIIGHAAGHRMPARWKQFVTRRVRGIAWRPLELLDQPARKHGAGILLHPLIEKGGNLFAEIGGVSKTRKLIALERVARSREKELPRRLGVGTGHVGLQIERMEDNR